MHIPRRLARTIRGGGFEVKIDNDFAAVIEGCAASSAGRRSTWINGRIRNLYADLFALGHCHTVEVWMDGKLAGGLYGVHLGRAFFGESMFSRVRDASKIALVYLVARLRYGGFELLDTQFVTPHLAGFGAIEVGRSEFQRLLEAALYQRCQNGRGPAAAGGGAGGLGAGNAPGAGGGGAAAPTGAGGGTRGFFGLRVGNGAGTSGCTTASAGAPGTAAAVAAGGAEPSAGGEASAFWLLPPGATGAEVLQLVSQTSKTGCSTA
jgi:leucyl/phenylalanyl-tRNA--protein transferase